MGDGWPVSGRFGGLHSQPAVPPVTTDSACSVALRLAPVECGQCSSTDLRYGIVHGGVVAVPIHLPLRQVVYVRRVTNQPGCPLYAQIKHLCAFWLRQVRCHITEMY